MYRDLYRRKEIQEAARRLRRVVALVRETKNREHGRPRFQLVENQVKIDVLVDC